MTKVKKTRCSVDGCKTAIAKIVGHCAYCDSNYCLAHRLPEQHTCEMMCSVKFVAKSNLAEEIAKNTIKLAKVL